LPALVGRSGAGKTTVAHLLMRFRDPQEGRITLGGHDLRDFPLDDLRTRLSLVSQDIYLFNVSIRENPARRTGRDGRRRGGGGEGGERARLHPRAARRLRHARR
jgi:ABC-type transport system involved in Fe-S cluster assembly fused permease/ATPase subunit